jgi:hypothetical protein
LAFEIFLSSAAPSQMCEKIFIMHDTHCQLGVVIPLVSIRILVTAISTLFCLVRFYSNSRYQKWGVFEAERWGFFLAATWGFFLALDSSAHPRG